MLVPVLWLVAAWDYNRQPLHMCVQMEALQQQWDNSSSAMEGLQAEDKRIKKHVSRLQHQVEVTASNTKLLLKC